MQLSNTNNVSTALYTAAQSRDIDHYVIESGQLSGYELMMRAGQFAFDCLQEKYPQAKRIVVFCGGGNNGGDGYIVAALAKQSGLIVNVYAVAQPNTKDAKKALEFACNHDCEITEYSTKTNSKDALKGADVIVDALLGTGVDRLITGWLAELVGMINDSDLYVLSCDVPTGLNSDTGCKMGIGIKADITTTFITLKAGMFSADGKECCGEVKYSDLDVDSAVYSSHTPVARLITASELQRLIKPRSENAHKGTTGYAAVIGGAPGMLGAVLMAGKAAYRVGAGRVKVFTHPHHASQLALVCPELLTNDVESGNTDLNLSHFQAVALGPGLSQDEWARLQFNQVLQTNSPLVIDADGLNLLAAEELRSENWILTPHPGEAARLLKCTSSDIQSNRFDAVNQIVSQYGGVCVLKGSGTLVAQRGRVTQVCNKGNSGQATAGMGDVLTGCIVGLLAQGYKPFDAACLGVWLHSSAADACARKQGKIGIMATDLFAELQIIHNQLACQ